MRAKLIRESAKGYKGYEDYKSTEVVMEHFTLGEMYEVLAIYQVEKNSYLLLINDYGHLVNRLVYCFELEGREIPEDWQINVVSEKLNVIIGPEFLIEYDDLGKLVEHDEVMFEKLKSYWLGEDEEEG